MRTLYRLLIFAALLAALTSPSFADVPKNMNIQGILKDGTGDPLPPGFKEFTFKIFDAAVAGTEIWPLGPGETQFVNTDAEGLWTAAVGTVINLTDAVFQDTLRWLEITVDDGVNPPETLSRIKLNTSPYAYRAATSQQADSLAGLGFDELQDLWVNETGDTMSSQLEINWPVASGTKPPLHVTNVNDGLLPFSHGLATWGAFGEAHSSSTDPKYGVYGYATGGGQAAGVTGYAAGTGTVNIGLLSFVETTATQNYSGYFLGGDVAVVSPASTGTLSVRLPDSAIDNLEILDEPGITQGIASTSPTLVRSTTSQNFASTTINTPDAGYIVVNGQAYVAHVGDSACFSWVQITETSNAARSMPFMWGGYYDVTAPPSSYDYQTIPIRKVYFKTKGTYTFYLQGNEYEADAPGSDVFMYPEGTSIMATFYPVSYGVVSTVSEQSDDASAQTATPGGDRSGGVTAAAVTDLRLLELEVVRAEVEAVRARNALLEAQIQLGRQDVAKAGDDD